MKAVNSAKAITPIQATTARLAPFLAWIDSVSSRVRFLNMGFSRSAPRDPILPSSNLHLRQFYLRQSLSAPILSAPRDAEQETETGHDRERGIGPCLERLVDGLDEVVGHFAHGVDRVASFVLGVGHNVIDARFGALPGRIAMIGDDAGDLLRQPGEVVAQRLQVALDVAGSVGGGFADFADAF